ncbi:MULTISPECIES: peptidoglycan-binding protein [Streptomyces]|uniref:peptidoglycan-binding protein n=1 Tax=unclassified Streptomyces TaxID=2593676 RepID=UPI0029B3B8FB|nr:MULTISPECIES: peptidoglycan-binding protein [unclassified Streptomyces]MDX2731761.1 peptidoglycan-binding protein [Streptomyces sp. PA03-2a]MDX3767264.1 peptidoglycan-binding protein [Streptomyces sp. AK08-01B]MDX3817252.1 peptidoglycan-binding protein [Streptomyces sp. AK08-01A]
MPRRAAAHTGRRASVLAALAVTALTATGTPAAATSAAHLPATAADGGRTVDRAFVKAAGKYDVPRDLLAAVGYGETHLDGHTGRPSQANGYGVMHLASNPANRTLEKAAAITGEPLSRLRRDTTANILGGAAVLRSYADRLGLDGDERDDIDAWYPAVAQYSGTTGPAAARYADTVYAFLTHGFAATVPGGEQISVTARPVAPEKGTLSATSGHAPITPYPSALWVPADAHNFSVGRTATIDKVIIHVTQGSYEGSIKWFQDPEAEVSAHYVVRSSDGQITQTVRDSDTAYHAKQANASALGIEHEGYIDDPSWFTDTMYRASAALTRALCDKYGIPKDRAHIIGHDEAPGTDHTDPGRYWDWNRYMGFVEGDSSNGSGSNGSTSGSAGDGSSGDGLGFDSYPLLQSGASGAHVTAVQQLLNTQGFAAGTVDGSFGAATLSAVKAYQTRHGLPAGGNVGPKTWTALLSAGSTPTLRQGDSGADVKRLQRSLTAALGTTVDAVGTFGPVTATAVRTYQTRQGLAVTGIVSSNTWAALHAGR